MEDRPTCFIAMPITTHDDQASFYSDPDHWAHVMEALFVPAIEMAGYKAVRPVAQGSSMIHAEIVKNLENSDLVLCDFSSQNANVFFELGVRTALDKPVALVRDGETSIPFDLGGMNAYMYSEALVGWAIEKERQTLSEHLTNCAASSQGNNPLWGTFGLTIRAKEPELDETPAEATLALLLREISAMREERRASTVSRPNLPHDKRIGDQEVDEIRNSVIAALTDQSPLHGSKVKRLVLDILDEDGYQGFVAGGQLNVALARIGVPLSTDSSGYFLLSDDPTQSDAEMTIPAATDGEGKAIQDSPGETVAQ